MHWESILLLVVIVLGGTAVIGSYVAGLKGKAGAADTLWGGVPPRVRPLYGVSMILSAVGFLAVLYYVFFRMDPAETVMGGRFGFAILFPIFVAILVPSALWLRASREYVDEPSLLKWIIVRSILFIVALGSIALIWAFFALETDERDAAFWVATVGSCYFAFHTLVLDAVVWAWLFRRVAPESDKAGGAS